MHISAQLDSVLNNRNASSDGVSGLHDCMGQSILDCLKTFHLKLIVNKTTAEKDVARTEFGVTTQVAIVQTVKSSIE